MNTVCDANRYEGDIDGYVDHLVNDHGMDEAVVGRYRRCVDQGSWMSVDALHRLQLGAERRLFISVVTDLDTRSFDVRAVSPTLVEAQRVLDAEVTRAGRTPLEWIGEFDGLVARQGQLEYEVRPVNQR